MGTYCALSHIIVLVDGTIHKYSHVVRYSFAKDSVEYKKKMELANKNNTRAELGHVIVFC